ncbi:MAG: hypothetical protein A2Z14_08365 [Chloroflexi bacterium RBG_16_48_8]|nr:MAG: hypothetical protein A2Z14_08365 [Chloroflexi bacterium RBG_16_48_8]
MSKDQKSTPSTELQKIIDSAGRLGIELDEEEAMQWLTAISISKTGGDVVVDTQQGIFGHKVSMLDFNPEDLSYFREIGHLVEFNDQPGVVETALALSGSAAQSKIQSYPGDCDYFERVNIKADTYEAACQILAQIMRDKVLSTEKGETYQLIEVKFGSYKEDVVKDGKLVQSGSPISWTVDEIRDTQIEAFHPDGTPATIKWGEAALDPGWCKLDWVVADPVRGQLANASNMLDVTFEAPDGTITPLDGYLDPYFQEVYLEAESIPVFSKLVKHVSSDALDDYVSQLEKEVNKYLTKDINYGKAAKRMYNIFRLTGRYEDAVFVRELFDEPATVLYQVWSLIRTIDDLIDEDSSISQDTLMAQADNLIISVIEALEGSQEAEIVRYLLHLKDSLSRMETGEKWTAQVDAARAEVINVVNNFFYERLTALPSIKLYIDGFQEQNK